jgi:TolA-binding protein
MKTLHLIVLATAALLAGCDSRTGKSTTASKKPDASQASFQQRMAQDNGKYTPQQLRNAEKLYQVASKQWGSPEAIESLKTMIKNYPDSDRAGCATLYLAQMSQGDERAQYLQDCIEKYDDCFYGDGVQVGAYARFLLAKDYQSRGEEEKAAALFHEITTQYAKAVDHSGRLLVDMIKPDGK